MDKILEFLNEEGELIAPPREMMWSRIEKIAEHGTVSRERLSTLIEQANAYTQWVWANAYYQWRLSEPVEPVRARDENGQYVVDDESTELSEAWEDGYTPSLYATALLDYQASEPPKPEWVNVDTFLANRYAQFRKYPSIEEQLDHIYHYGVESWKVNMVQPVKDKYPKPDESKKTVTKSFKDYFRKLSDAVRGK